MDYRVDPKNPRGATFTLADWEAQSRAGWDEIKPKRRLFLLRLNKHPAYFAWTALRWWADDDDIRAKDPEYGERRKRQLQGLLEQIDPSVQLRSPSDETAGDNSSRDQDR